MSPTLTTPELAARLTGGHAAPLPPTTRPANPNSREILGGGIR